MRTECPHCGQHYEVDQEYENQIVECTSCGQEFVVEIQPEQGNVVAPPPPEPPVQEQVAYAQAQTQTNNYYNPVTPEPQSPSSGLKALTCEMCGSTDLIKQNGVFVCQSCGTKYSLEEAKRMMIAGTVNVNVSNERSLKYAKALYDSERYDDALNEVQKFLKQNVDNMEALELEADIIQNHGNVFSAVPLQIRIIKKYTNNEITERKISSLVNSIIEAHNRVLKTYEKNYNARQDLFLQLDEIIRVSSSTISSLDTIYIALEQLKYEGTLYNRIGEILCTVYKINSTYRWNTNNPEYADFKECFGWNVEVAEEMKNIFAKYESKYPVPKPEVIGERKGGCYIATAVYGSYDCPEVWTLRRFRDFTLGTTWYGRTFIKLYYAVSPTIVKHFGQTKFFQTFWRKRLDKFVEKLHAQGVSEKPYVDKIW